VFLILRKTLIGYGAFGGVKVRVFLNETSPVLSGRVPHRWWCQKRNSAITSL